MKQLDLVISPKEEKRVLPPGWRWVRLGEVCDVVNGFGFAEHFQGRQDLHFPFIKVSDMNTEGAETVVCKAANTVDDQTLKSLRAKTYPPGTVIFPKVGGALLTNKKRMLGVQATFDNNIMGLVPKSVDSRWLFYWMQSIDLKSLSNVQALPSIKQSVVASLQFPSPPLTEQQRIAAILTEQMAAVERARTAAQAQLDAAKALPAAYLRAVFDSPEAQKWSRRKCQEIIDVRDGTHDTPQYVSEGIPLVTSKNLKPDGIDFSSALLISPEDHANIKKRSGVDKGDILFAMIGTIGNPVIVTTDMEFSIKNVALFKFGNSPMSPEFFYFLLQSPFVINQIDAASQGGIQRFVSLAVLRNLEIPLPRLLDQEQIAKLLSEKMASVNKARTIIEENLMTINTLPAALLRRAFNGEL